MSSEIMARVWRHSPQSGNDLLVLLALADWANDEGYCWPSIPTLARKARLSERTVQRTVARLCDADELQVQEGGYISGKNRTNTYRVTTPRQSDTTPGDSSDTTPVTTGVTPGTVSGTVSREPSETALVGKPPLEGPEPHLPGMAPAPQPEAEVETGGPTAEIWTHFVATFPNVRDNLTPSRIRVIEKALKETDDVELLKRAITGLASWRREKPGTTSLSTVFTTRPGGSALQDQIEWWAAQADGVAGARPGFPSTDPAIVLQHKLSVIEAHDSESDEAQERGKMAARWLADNVGEQAIFRDHAPPGEPRVQWVPV